MNEALLMPDDLTACHSLISQLAQTISEQHRTIQEQQLTINELMQRAFRHRSERYLEDPNQLKLDFGDTPEAADAAAGLAEAVQEAEILVAAYKRRKRVPKKPRSERLPEHLPRYEVEAPVPDEVKHCAEHGERKVIGHDQGQAPDDGPDRRPRRSPPDRHRGPDRHPPAREFRSGRRPAAEDRAGRTPLVWRAVPLDE